MMTCLSNARHLMWLYSMITVAVALWGCRRHHIEKRLEARGSVILAIMLSFILILLTMWEVSPAAPHWEGTFYGTSFGIVGWFSITNMCFLDVISPWKAIGMIVESTFGIVVFVYFLVDCTIATQSEAMVKYQERLAPSAPSVLMVKVMARTAWDIHLQQDPSAMNAYIDCIQVLAWVSNRVYHAPDLGDCWFLIFVAIPVIVSSIWLDRLVVRVLMLLRTNARLIRSAFAATIRVDTSEGLTVLQSSKDFNTLVDGSAEGMRVKDFVTATRKDLLRLCSPSDDRVVRRLRTSIFSISRSFQQDVELRLLSATESEMHLDSSYGIALGVVIMGERVPCIESETCYTTSVLMEQHLDEIGQLLISKAEKRTEVETLPEIAEVTSWDSVSMQSRQLRRRRTQASVSSSEFSEAVIDIDPMIRRSREPPIRETSEPYPGPWKATTFNETKYLKEAAQSTLEEIMRSFNQKHTFCCHWHKAVDCLQEYLIEMRSWRACSDQWPMTGCTPLRQCQQCWALEFDDNDACWLCLSPHDD